MGHFQEILRVGIQQLTRKIVFKRNTGSILECQQIFQGTNIFYLCTEQLIPSGFFRQVCGSPVDCCQQNFNQIQQGPDITVFLAG